ncbi:methyltransferase domain-containing protein [Streptomyces sp. RB6PN25]|uniref:Methyltransferase domain-containing protein n=1 Tax=Streptomyces humicola TaxID=2953240 RepID=A0ABT1PRN4_9ACTN|nr:class I SAM-dependent methyltransferase [Streptomyces humicola]MCQ4080325.1 methyltransferase domain-containing protein [Streptomyces humicola]
MTAVTDWQAWQDSWDRQQEWYLPDREERFRVMLDMVEAVAGPAPRVLDLACGTGSISARVLRRFPDARVTGVDLDPALLTIARGYFEGDDRITFVTADLQDAKWTQRLPHTRYDAVLTATALHWLCTEPLRQLYGRIAGVLGDGGVFMNADHMPDESTPRLNAAERALRHARMEREQAAGVLDWETWWMTAAADERLAEPVARRYEIFGSHADGEFQPVEWHAQALREAGFGEARCVWRSVTDAIVLGLK